MEPDKLEKYKDKLLLMEKDILENIKSDASDEENPFEIDGDIVDRAEAYNSISLSEELSVSQKKMIIEIRKALQRIKDRTYGKCIVCNGDIEEDRLDAVPYAEKCKKHMNS